MFDAATFPWVQGHLVIESSVLAAVEAHARASYEREEECCGLLAGPSTDPLRVSACIPFENRANKLHRLDPETYPRTGRMYFDMDPLKVAREFKTRTEEGTPVKVLYHSHLDVGAYFSETDAAAATMGGDSPAYPLAYLVTSVRAGIVDTHGLFVWDPNSRSFVPSPFSVAG